MIHFSRSVLTVFASAIVCLAQGGGGVQGAGPKFRLVRSVSGTNGVQQGGRYIIKDPRTTFYLGSDQEVQAYFEWQAAVPGHHHCEGYWKNAEGKAVVYSEFDCDSPVQAFGAFWILKLNEGTTPGMWTLEAHVDGEVAGSTTFQIVSAPKPASAVPERQMLTPAEIYKIALQATVSIDKMRANGERLSSGSGFLLADGRLVTAFQVIDGADLLRVHLPNGQTLDTVQVANWNRWQDWAILQVAANGISGLRAAKANSSAVGDRCFFLNASTGNRTIVDANITGTKKYPDAGDRINLSSGPSQEAIGSPLLNEYGEVVGIAGGSIIPGLTIPSTPRLAYWNMFALQRDPMATPFNLVLEARPHTSPSTLAELAQAGFMVPPLIGSENVNQGSMSLAVDNRSGFTPMPRDERYEFSPRDRNAYVFIMWDARQKMSGTSSMKLFDLDNHLLLESKPAKLKIKPNEPAFSMWQLGLATVKPGTYRIDADLNQQPAWRCFFRVAE